MPDWERFRKAYTAGLPNAPRLNLLRRLEGYLDLPLDGAQTSVRAELQHLTPRSLNPELQAVLFALQRDSGISLGPAALQKFFEDAQQPAASDESRSTAQRFYTGFALMGELLKIDPDLNRPISDAERAKWNLQIAQNAIFARVEPLYSQTLPGAVTPESITKIEAIVADAKALAASTAPDNSGLPELLAMTGGAAYTLAGCYEIAGRNADAIRGYAESARFLEAGGDEARLQECKARATALEQRLSGNLDAAAAAPLASLIGAQPDSLGRVKALMDLAEIATAAGDTFEADAQANAAATLLRALHFDDPSQCGAGAALDSWIATASETLSGTPLLRLLAQVEQWYDVILSCRFCALIGKDKQAATPIEDLKQELEALISQTGPQAAAAENELQHALHRYYPGVRDAAPAAAPAGGPTFMDRCNAIDKAIEQIRDTCNERAETGEPMEDLLTQLHQLHIQADALQTPEYEAKTRLEEAYVLEHLGRASENIPIAREARAKLLAGKPATLASLPQAYQRYWYLQSFHYEFMGLLVSGKQQDGLDLAEGVIRDYETERYRVASDYRQSALLSSVAEFYAWAAFAAFKLQKWDNMLQAIDLIKARAAVRNRLTPAPPDGLESDLEREFTALTASGNIDAASQSKRRELWDLLSIARAQNATATPLPELTVATLQAALAPDEAFIAYFWLSDSVILTVAVDSERFHAERIALEPAQLAQLQKFVAFIQKLKSTFNMDQAVARLGDVLLPAFLRDFIKSKKRVILSPHRSLHLFPFHAARWGDSFLGAEFAVSYVPNFSSVLLPWDRRPDDRVLALGIGSFPGTKMEPLPNVEDDVRAIQQFYRGAGTEVTALLGDDATRERIESLRGTGELARFRCIHWGTHGLSVFETPNQPLESRLLLRDGGLDAMDIANLRLNAEVAVLSACHSGERALQVRNLGELPGDDIFGLQSALFKSGVRSILGTLWLVKKESASAITREFHRHFATGVTAETALQMSVREYLADASHERGVYYWAPFFLSSLGRKPTGDS